jgi:hypothetical protein
MLLLTVPLCGGHAGRTPKWADMRRHAIKIRQPKDITLNFNKNVELTLSQRVVQLADSTAPGLHQRSVILSRLNGDYGN